MLLFLLLANYGLVSTGWEAEHHLSRVVLRSRCRESTRTLRHSYICTSNADGYLGSSTPTMSEFLSYVLHLSQLVAVVVSLMEVTWADQLGAVALLRIFAGCRLVAQ